MEKCFRSTAKLVVLLTYAYVETIMCITMKRTDPNVCPRTVNSNTGTQTKLILECCPDYIYQNGKCQACPAGKFGKNYLAAMCLIITGAVQKVCNCTDNKKCNPVHGCVCETGYTGSNCSNSCQSGKYGVSCSEECFCANNAGCDPVTGGCLCSAGWFGPHCTKECALGTFGKNCSGICDCPEGAKCGIITGICNSLKRYHYADKQSHVYKNEIANRQLFCNPIDRWKLNTICDVSDEKENLNSEKDSDKSNTVMVYIMMAAALIGLVCVVTMVVKVKDTLCRQVQKPKKDTSKPKLKRRIAKRRRSSVQTQDAQTGSFIIVSEFSMFPPPMEEDVYCEIGDISTLEPNRY
ncbi:MEGF10_11 [Mytilus coruscus]|uniref:MEGF10_11 n=1 Tax=Mytilus coruscus TaxID=42192 RepID=A0A6J8CKJ6_MYTCO|nr:MEGF10_11 [Mytilus coruscus]